MLMEMVLAPVKDCDDGDPNIPSDEYCDGVDNDCDGDIDEADALDATSRFVDDDEDGLGSPQNSLNACSAP